MQKSPEKKLMALFPQWELSQYPKQLHKAIAKVEHQEYIKTQLYKMEQFRKEDIWDAIAGKKKGSGRVGLDQLPISDLASLDNHNFVSEKKLPAMNLLDTRQKETTNIPTFKQSLADIVNDIESIDWLPKPSIARISNIFILTFARRYDTVQKLISPNLTVPENRMLTLKIVEQIRTIVREVLELLYKRFQFMNRVGMFSEESNSERISTIFRTIINRKYVKLTRLENEEIMDFSIRNLQRGNRRHGFMLHEDRNIVLSEVLLINKLKQDLDRSIRPSKELYIDPIVLESQEKKRQLAKKQVDNMPDLSSRFQNGKYSSFHVLPQATDSQTLQSNKVNDDLLELIYGVQEKKDSSKQNIWQDDHDTDSYQRKARDILQYNQQDLRQFMAIKSDDPILQAHSVFSNKFRDSEDRKIRMKIPTRYLKHRSYRWKFNFDRIFSEDEVKVPRITRPIVPKETSKTRIVLSKTSKIVSKDHILDTETPLRGSMQFSIKDANLANIDLLDANLSRFKEVEELYAEIMKSVDESKIEKNEDIEFVYVCPAAPEDQSLNDYYETDRVLVLRNRKPKSDSPKPVESESGQVKISANVLKRTQRARVQVDLFRRNRKRAMMKTKSSKYHFKYNYGGYIPAKVLSKEAQMNQISGDDYDDHLANIFCDFIPMLIYKEKRENEKLQKIEQERIRNEELLQRQREREEEEKLKTEKIQELFEPEFEKWKASVLDYIAPEELKDEDIETPSAPTKTVAMQDMLERLWERLEMPTDQRLDMAIKYGSHKFTKLGDAMKLWQEVSDLILERETLLAKIEEFEMRASNPNRFFAKGPPSANGSRLKEATEREALLRPLHTLESRIANSCSVIRAKLAETVTFKGIPYLEKMKVDYNEIVQKCTKKKDASKV